MELEKLKYKKAAFVTYTLRDSQAALIDQQFNAVVDCYLDAYGFSGLINGHVYMHFDGDKLLKVTVPYSKAVGGKFAVGMTLGHFIRHMNENKLFEWVVIESGVEKFNPDLAYIALTDEEE